MPFTGLHVKIGGARGNKGGTVCSDKCQYKPILLSTKGTLHHEDELCGNGCNPSNGTEIKGKCKISIQARLDYGSEKWLASPDR